MISVVIPTYGRPAMLLRAVRSVLAQTYAPIELVVVIDGPDPETQSQLGTIADSRLSVVLLPAKAGGAEARNAGVRAAKGDWVAFLDDDDEWLPAKLEQQMKVAIEYKAGIPIVTSRFIARTSRGDRTWPERLPSDSEPICEYLLARKGLRRNDGFISTITILTAKSLLLRVPFRKGLKRHQDWDWVIRATNAPGVAVLFCPEALAIVYMEDNDSVSRRPDWQYSLHWINEIRALITPRAYAGFVTTHVAWQASAQKDWKACLTILSATLRNGRPTAVDFARHFAFWFIPTGIRRRLAELAL